MLSPTTIARIFEQQSHGNDLAIGIALRFGIGYALRESADHAQPAAGAGLLLGRMGRLGGGQRCRARHDRRLHDEQDGAGHHSVDRAPKPSVRAAYAALG